MASQQVKYFDKVIKTETYLKQRELMDSKDVNKLEQAYEVHGYRGASKAKHNGVVLIKPSDSQLWKSHKKFSQDVEFEGDFIGDVKVVAHLTDGTRAIGSVYEQDDNLVLYLLGFSNYNHQLF